MGDAREGAHAMTGMILVRGEGEGAGFKEYRAHGEGSPWGLLIPACGMCGTSVKVMALVEGGAGNLCVGVGQGRDEWQSRRGVERCGCVGLRRCMSDLCHARCG